jgi:uncharacterized phage-associated protein
MENMKEGVAPYDARAIANLVLDKANEIGAEITQLQLYKMMYFAHGWYLATEEKRLIQQDFQAWSYGPVIRVVRDAFKDCGKGPIRCRAERLDIYTGEFTPVEPVLDNRVVEFVSKVVSFYHVYDGWELSDMTHEEGSPWDQVWNSKVPIGNLGLRIDESLIRNHFSRLPNRFSQN